MDRTCSNGVACVVAEDFLIRAIKGPSKSRFEAIVRDGKRATGRLCWMASLPGSGRVGIGAAKAIGNVPSRNRQKRRLKVAMEMAVQQSLQWDWVAVAKPAIVAAVHSELCNEVAELADSLRKRWESE